MLGDNTKPRYRRQYNQRKGKEIQNVLCTAIPDINVRKDVLSYILKGQFNVDICFDKVKKKQLSVVDCIAIRMKGGHGMSNRSFERMMKALVLFMKDNNMLRVSDPIPLGLRKKMGNLEGKGTLRVKHQLIRCATGGDKTEMCLHYWIPQIPLLVDKLISSCIEQGKFEDSFSFSHLPNKIIIGVGCDRGGGDFINLM